MTVYLHNPTSIAHLEDLKDRLSAALASVPHTDREAGEDTAQVEAFVKVVRAMEHGAVTTKEAMEAFAQQRVPGFRFGRWIIEMVDEDIYILRQCSTRPPEKPRRRTPHLVGTDET